MRQRHVPAFVRYDHRMRKCVQLIVAFGLACGGCSGSSGVDATPAASLPVNNDFTANSLTISTSEGAPYGDCDIWTQTAESCTSDTNFGYGPTKVMRLYICLNGEVSAGDCSNYPVATAPLSSTMLSDLDTRLTAFESTGMRVMIRFIYNFGDPNPMDAPIDVISAHIDELAPIVMNHKDIVFALEAGFIGTWGEWHDSTNGNDDAASQKAVLDKELSYVGDAFPILVRYPGDLLQYLGNTTPPVNFGLHDDYYDSDDVDGGTWLSCVTGVDVCPSPYTQTDLQTFAAAVSTTTMFVGEFGALDAPTQTCDALAAYSYTYHPQSIALGIYPSEIGTELQSEGCIGDFFNKVGTRIELQQASLSGSATPNGQLAVALTMVNTGYGRVVRARPASLIFTAGGDVVAQLPIPLADLDLRALASASPAVPQTFQFDVTLPSNFPSSGNVAVSLLIPDPAPSLTSSAAYALPLNSGDASGAIFDPSTGLNRIATFSAGTGS